MDLKDFVEKTIIEIVEGVMAAQAAADTKGTVVVPRGVQSSQGECFVQSGCNANTATVERIHFKIGLTAADGEGTKGGIGVTFGAVTLGSAGQTSKSSESTTSVSFSVPVLFRSKLVKLRD